MSKQSCKGCTKRKVGCHSTCQEYAVNKVIQMYKNQKKVEDFDAQYDPVRYNRTRQNLNKQLSGY